MALVTETGNKVWQKAKNYLSSVNANPASQNAFFDLKAYFAQQKRNPDLQFIPFTAEQMATDGGVDLVGAACTVYGVYLKGRRTTGTTAAWQNLHDAASNAAATTVVLSARQNATGQEFAFVTGAGEPMATGATIASSTTTPGGATESTAANAADGFLIVGA